MVVSNKLGRLNLNGNIQVISTATFDVVCFEVIWLVSLEENFTTGSILGVGLEVISVFRPSIDFDDVSNILRGVAHTFILTKLEDTVIIAGHPEGVVGTGGWDEPSFVHITVIVALVFRCGGGHGKGFVSYVSGLTGVIYSSDGNFGALTCCVDQYPSETLLAQVRGICSRNITSSLNCAVELSFGLLGNSAANTINGDHRIAIIETISSNGEVLTSCAISGISTNFVDGWH